MEQQQVWINISVFLSNVVLGYWYCFYNDSHAVQIQSTLSHETSAKSTNTLDK